MIVLLLANRRSEVRLCVMDSLLHNTINQKVILSNIFLEAKAMFLSLLPWWEYYEIDNYPKIWYIGENTVKKLILNRTDPNNYGFDSLRKNDGGIFKIVSNLELCEALTMLVVRRIVI